jgi:serine/threonine protein kinase
MFCAQYWQGCLTQMGGSNPLAGMWEVDMEVVSTMSMSIHQPTKVTKSLVPVIHFGMLSIETGSFSSGGFSRVYRASYKGERVAVKLLFGMELNKESIIMFYKEAQILQDLNHKNIVSIMGVTVMPPAVGIIMEYCAYGSLYDFLYIVNNPDVPSVASWASARTTNTHYSESRRTLGTFANRATASFSSSRMGIDNLVSSFKTQDYQMMLDAASGLAHMHEYGFMHCDIKSLNYLVTRSLTLKLSDFGEVRPIANANASATKPPKTAVLWCAPELLVPGATGEDYTPASDVFSLAMVLSEVLLRHLPLENTSVDFGYNTWYTSIVEMGIRPILPERIPSDLRVLIERAWDTDPAERPPAAELCAALERTIMKLESEVVNQKPDAFSIDEKGFELSGEFPKVLRASLVEDGSARSSNASSSAKYIAKPAVNGGDNC